MLRRILLVSLLALAAGTSMAQGKKLRIGVEGAYPPFSEVGTDGKMKGFEIDLAWAFCQQMQRECELVQQEFDALIPALQARKIDAIVASLSITEERRKTIAYSDKYYSTPARFYAKAQPKLDVSPAGLKGKRIGVQSATIHERYIAHHYKDSQVVRYATQDQIYLDLRAGRLDIAFSDGVAADFGFLQKEAGKGFGYHGPTYDDPKWFGEGVGVGLRKADAKTLGSAFNAAIAALRKDGRFKAIQDKYFAFDIYGRP
ncbi:MAG: transporter substrate-binding domain-containing protein [Burkholderiales bacterium]|nr:transporter substrate-binding domain-containing protein [Burkholderiales bacterium]